jgi:DNA-directed RNA polymerase specialized sigma24 family protein
MPPVEMQGRRAPERSDGDMAAELVRAMKRGDPKAFLELYELYGPSLYAYLYLLLGEKYGAAQAVQDVFELGFDLLPEDSPVPIRTWLFWAAHRRAGATRTVVRDLDPEERDPLVSSLIRLPPGVREALALRHVFGFRTPETAVVLDRSPGMVETLEHRGLESLARCLATAETPPSIPPQRHGFGRRSKESPVAWGRRLALAYR